MSLSSQIARYETLRSVAFGAITANYTQVGALTSNPIRIIEFTNTTDKNLLISFDGVNNMIISVASELKVTDYGSNYAAAAGNLELPRNTGIFVKAEGALPTSGSLYITTIYASAV